MRRVAALLVLCLCAAPTQAQQPQRAGDIRALVPAGHIQRGSGSPVEAKRSDPVLWQDVLRTSRGGRMRVGLLDGSILNVGSESQLEVRQHDPASQNTQIDLAYGRIRAKVVRLVRPGSDFRVRTPVANAGVVGTRFFIRVLPDATEILCLEGSVRVRNRDDSIAGEVTLRAGAFTRVLRGQPPTPPPSTFASTRRWKSPAPRSRRSLRLRELRAASASRSSSALARLRWSTCTSYF